MDHENEAEKCQRIYRNIIDAMRILRKPTIVIREVFETDVCDKYYDFSRLRQEYETTLGSNTLNNIMSYKETSKDLRKVEYAYYHHFDQTYRSAYDALNTRNKIWFYTKI